MVVLIQNEHIGDPEDMEVEAIIITETTTASDIQEIIYEAKENGNWYVEDVFNKLPSDCKVLYYRYRKNDYLDEVYW